MATLFSNQLLALAQEVIQRSRESARRISCAESCTGGLLSALLTEIPGSSAVIHLNFVTYANEAKTAMLAVEPQLLAAHGAVSKPVALAMASGARRNTRADIALAITGIAGPGGGSAEKPVGTVYIATASDNECTAQCFQFIGDRTEIRLQATEQALLMLLDQLRASGD
ncbi:MAG: CinA family protein [Alphaproteobacteria bacterium]|nr:CinA family protein [Alphaproteobacteria bacterium]